MANTNDNISKLHQALKAKGYNDIGSEDEFRTFVSNDSNVKALHQSLKAAGYNDLGSEDEFGKWLKMGGEAATQTPEQNSPQQSGQGQAVVKSPTEGSGVVPGSRDNVAAYEEGQTADGSLSGGSNGSEVPEVGKDTADVIKPQKVEPRQEPQEVAAPNYGSSEYLTETIGGDGSDGNPYAGMSRQQALNNVGRKFYTEWYGKPDAYSKIREELASYGITDVKDYSRAVADIRNSYIVPTAKRRINQLMSQFDKADERDLEGIRAVLDSRETQQAIEQDLKNLGFADTEDAYAKDDLEGRAAARQQWQMVKDSYYKTLEKQLENLAADKYNYLPASDARSHARQFARDLLGGGSEQHDERIKNREAFDMTTKYVSPQVGKYFSEAEQNAKNAFATYQAGTGGQSLPGMEGLYHQVIWNKHTDPEKIWAAMEPNLKRIGESVIGNPDFMREAEAHADEEGVELADYMEHRVLPVFEASIQHEFERMAVEQEMPENFLGYAAAKMRESLVGTLLNAAFTSQARRRAQQRAMQLTDEGQGIYKPSIGARIGGGVAGMLPDLPLFGIVGKVAAPVGTGVVQTLSESGVRPLVSRLGGASISGALTMGGVETGKGFFEGLLNDNEYENLGEAVDRSFLDALGDAVKTSVQRGVPSFVSGLTMIGGPLGQRISNGRGIIGTLLGWGTQTGVDAAGATGMSVAMGDIKPEDAGEHFAENLGTFAALGLQHKAKEFKALADGGRSWNGVDFSKAEIRTLEEFGLGKLRRQLSSMEHAKNGGGLIELSMLGVDAPKSQVEAAKSEGAKLYNDIMHSYGIPQELKLKVAQAMGAPIPYYAIKPDVLDLSAQVPAASVDLGLIDVLNHEYNFGIAEKLKNEMMLDDYELTVRLLFQDNKAFNAAMEKQQRGERLTNAEQELVDTNMERFATVQREYFRREHERINSEFEKEHGLEAGTIDRMMDDVAKGKAVDNDTMKSYEEYLRDLDRQLSDLKAERDGLKEAAKEEPDTGAREEGEPAGETAGTVVEEPVVAEENPIANGERKEGGVPKDDNNNQNEIAGTNEGTPPPLVMDDNGEVAWEQSPVEATIAGLSARVGRDRVGQIVDEELNGLTEEITKISEWKVSGMNERLKREAEIEALAERMVYWQQVKDAITPKEEGEKPEEPAEAPAGEAAGTVAVAENVGDLDNAGGEAGFETGTGANEPPAAPTRPAGEAAGTVAGERPVAPTAPVGEAAGTGATGTVAEERPTAPTAPAGEAAGTAAGERPAAPVGPAGEAAGTAAGIEEKLRKVHKFDKFKVGDVTLLDVLTEDEQRQVLDAYERGDKEAVGNLTGDFIQSHREDIILKGRDDRNSKVAKIMNGNGSREQKLRKVRELYKGYSDAEVALEDGTLVPTTLEEYISDLHSRVPKSGEGPLAYFSYERDGMKVVGMKDETGYGAKNGGDTDAFKPWLAPKGKGMSLRRYAEQIHSQLPEAMQEQFSDQDVRNAINEVFTSAERPSDITSMILKRGVQQAEQAVRRMEDGWIEDAHDYQKVSPADTSFAGRLEKAKQQTNAEPTEKQKEAGNYKKGHVSFGGYDFVVENPAGSIRRGRNTDTNETWEQKMNNTYGYILGKRGKDGDHLDMFINDDADLDSFDGKVYVIDQVNADGSFDEHKIMFGFDSEEAAREAYLSNYEEGWQGLGKITGVDKETFDKWLDSSDRKIKAFAEHSIAKNAEKGRRDDVAAYEEGRKEATAEAIDRAIRDQLIDIAREGGVQVSTDITEGQKGIDDFYGEVSLSKGQKRARETASVSLDEEHQHAVISFADGAKVRNNLETLAGNLEKVSNQRKNFIKEVAKSLGATSDGSNSEYATFETKNGRVVTIRLADHNATVSNFDYRDELDGISIVVTPMKNQGIINDGDAHIVEYYYDAIKLRRADGKPLSDIVRSIEQVMYSGEYNDKTGLAEREEVNVGAIRPQKANKLDVNGRPMLFKTPDGLAYGYTYRGKIYIDPRIATSETPIHEYSHLWAEMKRKSSPKEWNHIKNVLLKDKMVQPFIDKVKEEYPELVGEGKDDAFVEEVLTQFSGRHGAEKLREMAEKIKAEMGGDATASTIAEAAIRRVKSVLNEFWQSVAKMMGWKYTNAEEIADRILSDLLEGKSPRDELRKALESGRLRDVVVAGEFDGMNERLNEQKVSKGDEALTVPLNGKKRSAKEQRERAAFAERQWRRAHERAEESISKLNLTDSVTVVDSIDDLQNAEKLSARQKRSKGWYDPDTEKIVIVMGNHRSPDDVVRTILNEGVARHGLRKLFGENFNQFLDNVYDNADARIKGEIDGLSGKKYGGDVHKSTEEYLGRLAEDTDFDGAENKPWVRHWFNQVKSAFLDMLKLIGWKGFKEELTDNELRYILWRSYKNLSEPGSYRNVFRSSEDAKVKKNLGIDEGASEIRMGHVEDELPLTIMNHQDEIKIRERVKKMSAAEAKAAYERINAQMLDENGLNIEEHLEKYKADWYKEHGSNGIGKAIANGLQALTDKYGSGMMKLRWELQDRIDELGDAESVMEDQPMFQKVSKGDEKPVFVSNALKAVEGVKQEKATAEQWLKMIEKAGGLKAGEDKWLGLSDWLTQRKTAGHGGSVTKQELVEFILENQVQIEESHYVEDMPEEAREKLNQFNHEFEELIWEGEEATQSIYTSDWVDWAYNQMVERYGDDFRSAFDLGEGTGSNTRLTPSLNWNDELSGEAKYYLGMGEYGDANTINSTRLEYTTEGLENKREIALTVPTIEPYNEHDEVHFGDAGGGRAVAWVRFGDTTDADDKRVLVIDEIQSKRHQDGREKGYRTKDAVEEEERLGEAVNKAEDAYEDYTRKMVDKYNGAYENIYPEMTDAERAEADRLEQEVYAASEKLQNRVVSGVPDAPFEKNWHELAMKRMLRYAAENGYDKIAWTTGEQQAERYNIGNVVEKIISYDYPAVADPDGRNTRKIEVRLKDGETMTMRVDQNGKVIEGRSNTEGKNLTDVVGKDLARRIMEGEGKDGTIFDADRDLPAKVIEGDGLRIGGEGMKGFYDEMLPRFMNKYGKKWGVKTGEVELPDIGDQTYKLNREGKMKRGLTMWSVDVTPEMKESVMEGQPMFQKVSKGDEKPVFVSNALKAVEGVKQEQFEIVQRENPMRDDYHTGIRNVGDIKTFEEAYLDGKKEAEAEGWEEYASNPDVTNKLIEDARKAGKITVYSSYPIKDGTFVTPSMMQAKDYAGEGRVYSKRVPLEDVAWITLDEGQYAKVGKLRPQKEDVEARDKEYADAVAAGDMEKVDAMLREEARRKGYDENSDYQGTTAFNGTAPAKNDYFDTKEERRNAFENGEYDGTASLGDYMDSGIDLGNLDWTIHDWRGYHTASSAGKESIMNLRNTVDGKKKTITMYRSVPSDVKENSFRNGDWVTPSREYAKDNAIIHGWGRKYRIIEQEVSVDDIWWDNNDINEWGYDDGKGYAYKNAKNNRKLMEPTYDEKGNLVPLSQRFNEKKPDIRFQRVSSPVPFKLSDSQKDAEGNSFYERKGSVDLWSASSLFAKAGRQDAPIRLTDRNASHIMESHGNVFKSEQDVFDFLDGVFSNATKLRRGRGRGMFVVVENDKTDQAAIIKLMPSETGDYYNVETAGYYRKSKWKDSEEVIADLSEPDRSDAAADASKPQVPDENGRELINAEAQTSSSGGKDTKNISDGQEKTGKVAMTSQQTEQNSQKDAVESLLDEVDRRRGIKLQRVSGESGPEPEMTPEERQYWNQWQSAMSKWKARNGLSQDAQEPAGVPRKEADESAVDYAKRVMQYSREKALWKTAPQLDDYRQSRDDKMVSDAAHQAEVYHGDLFMNESTARARRIAADLTRIRHAMSRQKAYDKATVKAVTDFAQDFMRMGFGDNLTRGEIERMLSSVKNAAGAPSVKKEVDKVLNILMDSYLRDLENRLVKLSSVKDLKQTAQGVEAQGKLELKGQRMIQAFREARQGRWTVERLRERLGEIAENMSRDDEEAPMWEQDFEGVSLALQYAENIEASRQEWEDLRQEYKDAVRGYGSSGRSYQAQQQLLESLEKSMQENKMERIAMYGDIIGRLEGNIGESMQGAKAFVEREREHVKLIHSMANFDLAGMDMGAMRDKKMSERFNGNGARLFLGPLATFEQLLKQFGSRASNGEGYLYDYYMRNWMDSVNRAFENEERAKEELDTKAREVFGSKVKRWSDLYDIVRKLPTAEVNVVDQGKTKNFELTQGNLLYIYMANKMTDGAMKLRNMGITEEQVEQIKDFLDPRLVELGDWLQEEYLPSKRAEYNKVHERMFGAPMAAIDHYFPIKILGDARQQDTDVANMANADDVLPSTITGSIIKRRRNALPLDILHTDALSLAIEHIEDMEHWAAQAEWNKDVNTLLSYTTFRNKVKNMQTIYGSGDQLWNTLQDAARIAAGTYRPKVKPGSVDKTVTNIAKGVTAAKISFRAYTAFKQLLSAPAFLHDVDMGDFVKYSVNPYGSWKWAMENMPVFRKRWKSRQAGDTRLQETESDWELWKNDVVQLASRWGMTPNALVDGVTCAVGARAIYETRLRRYLKQGMDEEKAKKRALQDAEIGYNLTQQSSEGAFVSQIQKDRTLAANMLSVFRNSSMSYTRQWVDAARNLKHRARKGYKEDAIDFMARLYQDRLDMDEAQARSAAEWQYARSGRRDIARLLNMMFGVTVAWNLGASLPYLLIGDDDDTKKDMLTDALMKGLIAGPTEGLAGGNLISDFVGRTIANKDTRKAFAEEGIGGAFDTALKGGGDFEINPLPLMADIESMIGKLGYDRYAALQDVFNICVQSSVGVNPQTFTDMFNAVMDYAAPGWDGTSYTWQPENMLRAKELALFMMRLANAPTSSWRGKYIDELGTDVTVDEAKRMPYDELAQRYAHYKHWKDAPFAGWLRGEEGRKEKMDKLKKQFEKAVLDRIGGLSDRSLEDLSLRHHGDSAFQATTAKELKKRLEGMSDEDLRYMYDNFFSSGDRVVPSKERQMAEKEVARRSGSEDYFLVNRNKGGNDDKGKAKKWAKNFYVTMRDWTDLEEDLELEKIRREAIAAGDDDKAKTVKKAYDEMNEWIYDLGSGERRRADGTVVDEDYRWQKIREIRREALEKVKAEE